jgi:hypothetical protein
MNLLKNLKDYVSSVPNVEHSSTEKNSIEKLKYAIAVLEKLQKSSKIDCEELYEMLDVEYETIELSELEKL